VNELALFAGAGGGILGGKLLGWRTVCAVELDPYARRVLLARQADGCLDRFPIWDDVRTFDGKPWRGNVDVISGGFPCQDISAAGKGAGITGARSGLWSEMARIIGEVRPRYVFVENSPLLVSRGLAVVLGDLASMGYDARWGLLGAEHAGAPHKRHRLWIVAYPGSRWRQDHELRTGKSGMGSAERANSDGKHAESGSHPDSPRELQSKGRIQEQRKRTSDGNWWKIEPDVGRVADGVAARVDRLRCLGNGQVPAVARLAWEILMTDFRRNAP